MNYLIETIGCQMNVCESDKLGYAFSTYGILRVDNILDADIVILNTCSVRAQAEQKAFSYLGRVEEFKQQKPNIKIVVIGCMAERLGLKIKQRFKDIDLVIGAKNADNIVFQIVSLCDVDDTKKQEQIDMPSDIVRYITIMKGCNNYCSYCVVPFVRGNEKSLDYRTIVDGCSLMVKNGAKEIMLLGQNVNSYQYENINFASLVEKVAAIKNLKRIRFMTNHPKDLNDDLINIMVREQKLCSHIHLPMQSASNKILKAMNRKYTYEHYLNLVDKLRTAISDISITTDIIVGFPGETDQDYKDTLNAIKTIRFGGLYVFKYSKRPNTKAFEMIDDVPIEEKKRRHAIVLEESNKISAEIVLKMLGSTQQVLVEKIENNIMETRTRNGRKVFVEGNKNYIGKQLNVNVKEVKKNLLFGDIV
ncbi:MAG: tRNA (N6-isopentenyl adenosine(37)-C2)-methylthiotransferase MiaB [Endomicrobium sp.]|nr:tRNA (N6-isopentenyl adenosine(37)-C2)-methylthiotransferase MiaB [Endomicrobium sp.]